MDRRERASLLVRSIVVRSEQLKASIPIVEPCRGSTVVPLIHFICDGIADRAQSLWTELQTAQDDDIDSYLRMLQQLLTVDGSLHTSVAKYRSEIDRHDLPVGLLYLVDSIVVELLGTDFDPLIHTDVKRMYSTDSLFHDLAPLIAKCGGTFGEPRRPVVFNVPLLDPSNAFLSPILVHEATHTYLRVSGLLADLRTVMPTEVEELARAYSAAGQGAWPHRIFENWLSELVCDCMALLITGPSFPLALSALGAATDAVPQSDTHPFLSDRLAFMWAHMSTNGWASVFAEFPGIADWFATIADGDSELSTLESTLRRQAKSASEVM